MDTISATQQSPLLEPKPKQHSKVLLYGILAFVFMIVIGGVYAGLKFKKPVAQNQVSQISPTSTPDLKTNWKTYTNQTYRFAIKYPANFIYAYSSSNSATFDGIIGEYKDGGELNGILLDITVRNTTNIKDIVNELLQDNPNATVSNQKINSLLFTRIQSQSGEGEDDYYLIQLPSGFILKIRIGWTQKNKEAYSTLASQIISTFKFTPASPTTSQGWDQNQTNALMKSITLFAGDNSSPSSYDRSQVRFPSNYFATLETALEADNSTGGMAPPRLILLKNDQALGSKNYFDIITKQSQNDCIVIWSGNGITTIDQWSIFSGSLVDKEDVVIGARKAIVYKMQRPQGNIYVGFLPIGNKDSTSYYFHTCNTNNHTDFINVLKSIQFTADNIMQ